MENIQNFLIKVTLAALATLAPIRPIMIAAGLLIVIDFFTGIMASVKRNQPITSYKMRRTIVKILAYESAIVFGFIMETWLIPEIPVVKVAGALVALTEAKSFFENINTITGLNIWQEVLNRVQGKPLDITSIKLPDEEDKK